MKSINIFAALMLLLTSCGTADKTITVSNPSNIDRTAEVIEIEIADADQYAVFDAAGNAVQCQTTYTGTLLFPATVEAGSQSQYTLRKAERPELEVVAVGKTYSEWYNNFAWENDKIGYRTYAMDIAETGAKLYGYDIFTKRGETPVLDILFGTQFDPEYQRIRKEIGGDAGSALSSAISIHIDHGLGMDYYAVGPTLGSGTAAIVVDNEIIYPNYFTQVEILDQGGLRHTFRLTLPAVELNGEQVTEVRTISLDAGSHFNNISVEWQGMSKASDAVIGIVLHDKGDSKSITEGAIAYAEPVHAYGWQTYNAIIFPEEMATEVDLLSEAEGGVYGHLLSKGTYTPGEPFTYYMGAGWNRWGFENAQAWFNHVAQQKAAFDMPLTYSIK